MFIEFVPKLDRLVVLNSVIVVVCCGVGFYERIAAHDHDKQDDPKCENINLTADIGLHRNDFWRLVVGCAKISLQFTLTVSSLDGGGETEVRKDEVEIFVKEDVVTLEVAMRQPFIVHIV